MNVHQGFFKRFFKPEDKFTWIGFIFLLKGVFFIFFFPYEVINPGLIGISGGDTSSYFSPIENLLEHGLYSPDYRMPGYGWIYLSLRLIFDVTNTYNIIIVLQWVVSSLSVYYLAKSLLLLSNKKFLFYATLLVYLISTSTNVLDYYLLTESFTTSALIFSIFFFLENLRENKIILLIASGAFVCWTIFMRPVLLPALGIFAALLTIRLFHEKVKTKKILQQVVLLCLPFLVCDAAWVIRNYIHYQKVIPLTTTNYPLELENTYYNELMSFMSSWGGDRTWWNPTAEIRWFIDNEKEFGPYTKDLPDYIYTSAFNRDSLLQIRKLIFQIENPSDSISKEKASQFVRSHLLWYTRSIKEEKPLLYYFTSKLILLKKFVYHSGTPWLFQNKFDELGLFKKIVRLFYTLLYALVFVFGILGILLLSLRARKLFIGFQLYSLLSLYILFIYPMLGHVEYRYLIPLYPLMTVCAVYSITVIQDLFSSRRGVSGS